MWDTELTPMERLLQEERSLLGDSFQGSKLLDAIKKGHILFKGEKIYLHTLDRDILGLYSHSFRHSFVKNKEWLLLYPTDKFKLFALFALESLAITSHVVKNKLQIYTQYKKRNRVLLISDDKTVRAEYINLNRKNQSVGLHYTYLRLGIVGADGRVRPIIYGGENDYSDLIEPFFLLSPSLDALPKEFLDEISAVIVDVNELEDISKIDYFRKWAVKHDIPMILYVSCCLRSAPVAYLLQQKIPAWGWNDEIIRDRISSSLAIDASNAQSYRTNPFISTLPNMLNLTEGITHAIIFITERKINHYLIELRTDAYQLKKSASDNSVEAKAVRQLYNLISSVEEMTAPLDYYEKYREYCWGCLTLAQRMFFLSDMVSRLKAVDQAAASFLSGILVKANEILDYMKHNRSGKPIVIEEIIKKAEKSTKNLVVVNRINAGKYALEEYLEVERGFAIEGLRENGILILSYSEFMKAPYFDIVLYFGAPPQYQLNILESTNSPTICFPLYASEQKIFSWLSEKKNITSDLFSYSSGVRNLSVITGISLPKITSQIKNIEDHTPRARKKMLLIKTQDAETSAEESLEAIDIFPSDEYASLEEFIGFGGTLDKEEEALAAVKDAPSGVNRITGVLSCMLLSLSEGRKIFVPTYRDVPLYDLIREKIVYKPVSVLERGDLIILVNKSSAKGLADAVVSRIKSHPNMVSTVFYQQLWLNILKDGMRKYGHGNKDVSRLLGAYQCLRTPAAVYQWVNGHIIGPSEKKVIVALGKIYRNQLLIDKADLIWAGINRLRSIHRTVSVRLKYFATHYSLSNTGEDELIDKELNLYLSDFKGIIALEEVEDVKGPIDIDSYNVDRILLEGFE